MANLPGESTPPHVLIISHDVVGSRMAGPGIRYWEMARVLAAAHPVTLVAPQPIDLRAPGVVAGSYSWGDPASLTTFVDEADRVIANGYVLQAHPELAAIRQPLALDLYDPVLLENLELFRSAPEKQRTAQNQQDTALLRRQLAAGDFFLCATERQRDLYVGALMAAGRITPDVTDHDPRLRGLIEVVPFGLPSEEPARHDTVLRGVVPGIGADDLVVLWTGGLWDWLDPLTLVRAMPAVVAAQPNTRLVFLAGRHPGNSAAMQMPQTVKAQAAALGLAGSHIFFYEQWIPYEQRADFLLEADIAVSLHHNHLETAYAAVRSRFLDHLWAGLPSVVSDGDAAAELVHRHNLGRVVRPGDPQELATAIVALIEDRDERQACGARARALSTTFAWTQCLAPLREWCNAAQQKEHNLMRDGTQSDRVDEGVTAPPAAAHSGAARSDDDRARNSALDALEQHWHIDEPQLHGGILAPVRRFFVRQFVRPFVVPLLERQNAYNAAATKAMYALAESSDRRHNALRRLETRVDALEQHTLDLDDADTALAERLLVDRRADEPEAGERV